MTSKDLPDPMRLRAESAINQACDQLRRCHGQLGGVFPHETSSANRYAPARWPGYPDGLNSSWTSGFWTGLMWMAHELQPGQGFDQAALAQLPSYAARLEARFVLDHHDLGFLFVPSCVAALRSLPHALARDSALQAADLLMRRYLPRAGVIQAWGQLDDPAQRGRIIIDCLLNLPLLHWASSETGDPAPREAARLHALRSQQYLVRADGSSFHTFHFDPHDGAPLHGTTAQGHSDQSCWARGQAWGLYGFALNHRWAPDLGLLDTAQRMADRFIAGLPAHGVVPWDLCFDEDSGEPWDSSASAIAACGLMEIAHHLQDPQRIAHYRGAADRILDGLLRHCAGWAAEGNVLLRHGVYSKPEGIGVDEASLWGDFFFLEALARRARDWHPLWHTAPPAGTPQHSST